MGNIIFSIFFPKQFKKIIRFKIGLIINTLLDANY
jgi:hypothetical protein